jgi:ADP-dependent NAD(P)H-hydrate dehydratase / NAD(P)H-hydrate epimerase
MSKQQRFIDPYLVTTAQMVAIEERIFRAGLPVAALMEKVGGLIAQRVRALYPLGAYRQIGVLVGAGHNGGDALVVARELHLQGYQVTLYRSPLAAKDLTEQHWLYTTSLGLEVVTDPADLARSEVIIEGLFGLGLNRSIEGHLRAVIDTVNGLQRPIVSIDLPAGLHTDSGEVLGTAIRATHTLCLGLWKMACVVDGALPYLGQLELIDFGIPLADIRAVLGIEPIHQRVTANFATACLGQRRSITNHHKYQQGHLLLIAGSRHYGGAAILAGLGARATGVGMLSIAVPKSLQSIILHHLPEAVVIPCPETEAGAIRELPNLDWSRYGSLACGCGLTAEPVALVERLLEADRPLVLDADGLNVLAGLGLERLQSRISPTILTPHLGELRRLCPVVADEFRFVAAQQAAAMGNCIVLFKGARTIVASPNGRTLSIGDSTPALARGGSGDVLTGLIGGLIAQGGAEDCWQLAAAASWCHAEAAKLAVVDRGERGLDPVTLSDYLGKFLASIL